MEKVSPNLIRKTGTLLLLFVFLFQNTILAQEGRLPWAAVKAQKESAGPAGFNSHDLSDLYGREEVKDTFTGDRSELIINIQDAHASFSAQESIAGLLQSLVDDYDLNLIAVEGSEGYINTNILRTFPVEDLKKKIGTDLMRKGVMSAGEFYSIVSEEPVALYGIEDDALYKENLKYFRSIILEKGDVIENLASLRDVLKVLRGEIYSKDLLELVEKAEAHKEKNISFKEYWKYASELARAKGLVQEIERSPNIKKLLDIISLEEMIDFSQANSQRDIIMDSLTKMLDRGTLEELVEHSLLFKKGEASPREFYSYLLGLAEKQNIEVNKYKDIISYKRYIEKYADLDVLGLFDEVGVFEDKLREALASTEDERNVCAMEKAATLLTGLFGVTLTNKEASFVEENREKLSEYLDTGFLNEQYRKHGISMDMPDLSLIDEGIDGALEFYRVAKARNDAMVRNTLSRMKEEGKSVAALITGGFHTKGLSEIMKKNELSYLVICPKFEAGEERPYIAVLTSKKGPYDELVDSGRYNLAVYQYFSGDRDIDEIKGLIERSLTEAREAGIDVEEVKRRWLALYRAAEEALEDAEKKNIITPDEFAQLLGNMAYRVPENTIRLIAKNVREELDLYGFDDTDEIVAKITGILRSNLNTPEDHWFFSRLIRVLGMRDPRQPETGTPHHYARAELDQERKKLINAVTTVYEFDKDDTLDKRSEHLSEESALRLARIIASGKKVGINTAKALKELAKKKSKQDKLPIEIYKPLRTAMQQVMLEEGWGSQAKTAADDLLSDLFEFFLDTAATRLMPVRGADSQKELVADMDFQAAFSEEVMLEVREKLIGDNMDQGLAKVLSEERKRMAQEGYDDYGASEPELNVFDMQLPDGRIVITKMEYRPFGPIVVDEKNENKKFKSNKIARQRVADELKKIFTSMKMGENPEGDNYGIMPVVAGSRSVDLNMLLPGGARIQKDRAIRYQFDLGHRIVRYCDNEALAGNGYAVARYNKELLERSEKDKSLVVFAVDYEVPEEMEGRLEEHGTIHLGKGLEGTIGLVEDVMRVYAETKARRTEEQTRSNRTHAPPTGTKDNTPIAKKAPATPALTPKEWEGLRNKCKGSCAKVLRVESELIRFMFGRLKPEGTVITTQEISDLKNSARRAVEVQDEEGLKRIADRIDELLDEYPQYTEFFHLIIFDRLKIRIDDIRDDKGDELIFYPREDKRIPGILAWEGEEKDNMRYVHITKAFYESLGEDIKMPMLAQCLAHEYRERNLSDAMHEQAHHEAVNEESIFASNKAARTGVSDLNLFYLEQAGKMLDETGDDYYLFDLLWSKYDRKKDPGGHFQKQLVQAILTVKPVYLKDLIAKCMSIYKPHDDPASYGRTYCKDKFLKKLDEIISGSDVKISTSEELLTWYRIQVELNKKNVEEITDEIEGLIMAEKLDRSLVEETLIVYIPIKKRGEAVDDSDHYDELRKLNTPESNYYTGRDFLYLPDIKIDFSDNGFARIKCPYNKEVHADLGEKLEQAGDMSVDELLKSILEDGEFPETYNAARAINDLYQKFKKDRKERKFLGRFRVNILEEVVNALILSVYSEEFVSMVVKEILVKIEEKTGEGPIMVSIAAAGGAGKTTLCEMIRSALEAEGKSVETTSAEDYIGVGTTSTDDYLQDREFRRKPKEEGRDVKQGPGMYRVLDLMLPVLKRIKKGKDTPLPGRDQDGNTDLNHRRSGKPDVFIVEGVMSLHGEVGDIIDVPIGISDASDARRINAKVKREIAPKAFEGKNDSELYILNDFIKKQFEEQHDTIKQGMLRIADYVWRFDPKNADDSVAYIREDSRNIVYGRVVAKFGKEPSIAKAALDKIKQSYKKFTSVQAIRYLFNIYIKREIPADAEIILPEEIADENKVEMPQVLVATMANNVLELEDGKELKEVDDRTAQLLRLYLNKGGILILTSGGSKEEMETLLIEKLLEGIEEEGEKNAVKKRIILCPCSGSRVIMFDPNTGEYPEKEDKKYHIRIAQELTSDQKRIWEEIRNEAIEMFELDKPLPGIDKKAVKHHDREDLFVLEMVYRSGLSREQARRINNELLRRKELPRIELGTDKNYDLRVPVKEYLDRKIRENGLPITTALASGSGLDMFINCDESIAKRFREDGHPKITLREAALKMIREDKLIERKIFDYPEPQKLEDSDFMIAARYYPDIRRAFKNSMYILFNPEKIEEEECRPKLFVGYPFTLGFQQFLSHLLVRYSKTAERSDSRSKIGDEIDAKILIGIRTGDSGEERVKEVLSLVSDAVGDRASVVLLEGTPDDCIETLKNMKNKDIILRMGLLDLDNKMDITEIEKVVGIFIDRADADVFCLTHKHEMKLASMSELAKITRISQPIISLDLSRKSIYEFEEKTEKIYSAEAGISKISRKTLSGLNEMKNTKKRKFVVWTSEFEKKGLPISVEIRMRRKAMNVTKETDPIKDFLVITDKSIIAEKDTAKRMRLAKRYLKEKGLDDVISIANVLFYTMEEPLPISGILTDVSMRGNFVNEIDPSDIIFGGIEGEFKYGADMEDIKVINLSSDAAYNLGMYRMMIEMLVSGTTDVPGFSQLMEGIEGKPNWYIYNLPKVIPENYKALYDEYRSYIENILSKA